MATDYDAALAVCRLVLKRGTLIQRSDEYMQELLQAAHSAVSAEAQPDHQNFTAEREAIRKAMGGYRDSDLASLAATLNVYGDMLETLDNMAQGDSYLAKCLDDARRKLRGGAQTAGKRTYSITEECRWSCDENEYSVIWEGSCGAAWSFEDGGPVDNDMAYCPKCGRPCVEDREDEEE